MKVLKDQGQVLQIINRKLNELRKKFDEADGEEASEISGQEVAIIDIEGHIRLAVEDHGYRNPRDTWFMKGLAKRAAWAMQEIEKRMR